MHQHPPADPATTAPAAPHRCTPGPVSTCQPDIAVVGGSLTGPVLALLLAQAGFDRVALYEAVPASFPQGGGLISLEHSALDTLDRLGIPQHEFVKFETETICQITVRDQRPADTIRRTYPGRLTTWTLLHHALTARLPADLIHTGRRVTGLAQRADRPLLQFADGHTEPADLVVFADGRSSTGRRLLDAGRRLRYAGYVAHRGTSPPTGLTPIHEGERTVMTDRHCSTAAMQQSAETTAPGAHRTPPHTSTRMAVPVMDIAPPTAMVWPVGRGHAVLLGDALAPVRPHTARGANNGIEQAAGLIAALTQHRKYRADLPGALTGWQRRHLPAAAAAVRLGPVIGGRLGLGTGQPAAG